MKRQATHSAGFSFVELMVAIAIVGVLSAIAVPNILKGQPEKQLKGAARNLYADMQRARLQAVRRNSQVFLRFEAGKNYYYFDDNGDAEWNDDELKRDLSEYGAISYGSGTAATSWGADAKEIGDTFALDILFTNTGTAGVAGVFEEEALPPNAPAIYLQNQNRDICYAVSVNSLGSVKIRKFNGMAWED